jgi:hypothetical protein
MATLTSAAVASTKKPKAPAAATPIDAASGRTSPNTPMGASARIQRTSTKVASATASKMAEIVRRASAPMRVSASPNSTDATMSGSMLPSAAARIGLTGITSTSQLRKGGSSAAALAWPAAARSDAAAAGSMGSSASSGGPASAP